jgi:hypothetical protein
MPEEPGGTPESMVWRQDFRMPLLEVQDWVRITFRNVRQLNFARFVKTLNRSAVAHLAAAGLVGTSSWPNTTFEW